MNFPQHGTIATPIQEHFTLNNLSLYKVTTTDSFDVQFVFNKISCQLDVLENKSGGTKEDLDFLTTYLNQLPRLSKERFECDFRINSLKKKWGLKKSIKQKNKIVFPIKIEDVNSVLIEKSHIEYINSGKDGRLYIQSHIKNAGFSIINSEDLLMQLVQEAMQSLNATINNVITAMSSEDWKKSIQKLGIYFRYTDLNIYKYWSEDATKNRKSNLKTIGQLKILVTNYEKKALLEEKVVDTIDNNIFGIVSNV